MIQVCKNWFETRQAFVLVRLIAIRGSAPRDQDAVMAVSGRGIAGTIGGGRLEWEAIQQARTLLAGNIRSHLSEVALGPEIGQCCGGRVTLSYQLATAAVLDQLATEMVEARDNQPEVHIYGAGHVGRALALALAPLPLKVNLIDNRPEELALLDHHIVHKILTEAPVHYAEKSMPKAAHVIMTHSHSLDSLLAITLLERGDFRYLGLIGSRTKRALFHKGFREAGIEQAMIDRVVCPIGGADVKDKRPEVIAALTAAEIVTALYDESKKDIGAPVHIASGYQPAMIGAITSMHARYYARHAGFGPVFESKVAAGLAEFANRLDQPCNHIWLALHGGEIVGSIVIDGQDLGEGKAHLRWFIVADHCRGHGVGKRLLEKAIRFCDDQGISEIHLWTFKGLDAARHLYEAAGFRLVVEAEGQQWGHIVTEQHFVLKC